MWEASEEDLFADREVDQRHLHGAQRSVTGELTEDDIDVDRSLRPKTLDEYCGQERIRENLRVLIAAAKDRGETLDELISFVKNLNARTDTADLKGFWSWIAEAKPEKINEMVEYFRQKW